MTFDDAIRTSFFPGFTQNDPQADLLPPQPSVSSEELERLVQLHSPISPFTSGNIPQSVPVTGGWQDGDSPGARMFANLGPLRLENGQFLPQARLAYETWGQLNADRSNAVLILHALTGDAHVCGPPASGHPNSGWWDGIVGPGKAIDTDRFFVVAPNVLGGCQGSTGPASLAPDGKAWGSRFPLLTTRDMVQAESRLADYLGISRFELIVGASAGGHRAIEWAVGLPERAAKVVMVASNARTTAEQAAWAHSQIAAIELDPAWMGGDYYDAPQGEGPWRGLGIARQIAHTTYRSAAELESRFGRIPQRDEDPLTGGRYAVQSYLDHHAHKLVHRFDAGSYRCLTRAMITHDIGRDRGAVESALAGVTAKVLAVGVDSDRLFFIDEVRQIANAVTNGTYREISTPYGHDGFLIETSQLEAILRDFIY